jgi:hypothetical protein
MHSARKFLPKTATRTLILWIYGITIITLSLIGVGFYQYISSTTMVSLEKQARLTADEISSVLTLPLYTLDDTAILTSAKVYLSSGSIQDLIDNGEIKVTQGDAKEVVRVLELFDRYNPETAVVIPSTLVQDHK